MKDDFRSKKIALVAHCVLNQNAVVGGLSSYPAMISNVLETLRAHGFSVIQLPCPEMYAAGLDRWGQVKEQYGNYGFKRSFKEAAEFILDSIADYVSHGYKIVVIGIEGSPSCGVNLTESSLTWGGIFNGDVDRADLKSVKASGVFMEVLFEKIHARGWAAFPAIDIPSDAKKNRIAIRRLEKFLSQIKGP